MTSRIRWAKAIGALAFAVALTACAGPVRAGTFDGSQPFLCAVQTVMECDMSGTCERHVDTADETGITFLRIDVGKGTITAGPTRTSTLRGTTRLDGRLILQGGEQGRGFSANIDEETGRLAAAVVDNDHTFSLFGACTIP
jgi:hypothetical protein